MRGLKFFTNCHGPLWRKNTKNLLLQNRETFRLSLGIGHWGLKVYQVCSNGDPKLTFDLLRQGRIFVSMHCMGKILESQFLNVLKTND